MPDLLLSEVAEGHADALPRTVRTPFALIATTSLDISSLESYKTDKSAGQVFACEEGTVAPPTADPDRDNDIVRLALAILDEEFGSWVKSRHRGRASQAEGVSEPTEQRRDTS